ncbi:hect e3 ubiquitin [Nannochloropsis oceanica]
MRGGGQCSLQGFLILLALTPILLSAQGAAPSAASSSSPRPSSSDSMEKSRRHSRLLPSWSLPPLSGGNCTTLASSCASCLSLPSIYEGTSCVWCPEEGGCVESAECLNPRDSCEPRYLYVVVVWLALSALLCCCCLACTTRRCLDEWRARLQGEGEGNASSSSSSSSSLYEPLLGLLPSSLRPGQRQSQPALPPATADPTALTEEERAREERAEVFRNSLMEQGGRRRGREAERGGEEEWVCAVCAFENRPRLPACCLCGTGRETSAGLASKWREESRLTAKQQQQQEEGRRGAVRQDTQGAKMETKREDEGEGERGNEEEEGDEGAGLSPYARAMALGARRMNQLTLRQKAACRRKLWQRRLGPDGLVAWVRVPLPPPPSSAPSSTARKGGKRDSSHSDDEGGEDGVAGQVEGETVIPTHRQPLRGSWAGRGGGRGGREERDGGERAQSRGGDDASEERETEGLRRSEEGSVTTWASGKSRETEQDKGDEAEPDEAEEELVKHLLIPSKGEDNAIDAPASSPGYISLMGPREGHMDWLPACLPIPPTPVLPEDALPDLDAVAALPFRQKHLWFVEQLAQRVQQPWSQGHIRLDVARSKLLEGSFGQIMSLHPGVMRRWMRVQFINEPGVDAGGLEREWFVLVSQALMDPALGLFVQQHGAYSINPCAMAAVGDRDLALQYYYFAGRVFGKALLEHQTLPVALSLPLLKHLLGTPITFSDLEMVDPDLYRSLCWVRDCRSMEALAALHLDFTVASETLGKRTVHELKPGGKDIALTLENKKEYLALMLRHRLLDGVKRQIWQLLRGVYEVVPKDLLSVFDYQELQLLMSGLPIIDVQDWKRHTEYLGVYQRQGEQHKIIRWFWEVVEDRLDEESRARLLQFTTGGCNVPAQGFKALQSNDGNFRRFNIQSVRREECIFPRAHTCFNKLDLPVYETKEELEGYLTLVINMEITGFTID